eukprot:Awhi_evm1s15300
MRDHENVAIGRPASASPYHSGYSSELALDGIVHLPYVGYMARELSNTFFEVDLENEYAIYEVRFLLRETSAIDGAIFTLKNGQGQQ